ncbi:MAG: CHAT domain-containing protein [Candidatus Paceibacterota bacterium]
MNLTLQIRQQHLADRTHLIRLTLVRPGQANLEAESTIEFALTRQEQEEVRWYLEDYLERAESVEMVDVQLIENLIRERGEELYYKVLVSNHNLQAIWFAVREQLADLRVEITSGIVEAAAIPWELMRDPQSNSPIALRVKSFVRVQSNPNISFVPIPPSDDGRVRLLYIVCRPSGGNDVSLRAVANRLLQDLGEDLARFDITALRPPTYEQLQQELTHAKEVGLPYHIVHFDGHGVYADLSQTKLADWIETPSTVALDGEKSSKHGYLLFEHPNDERMRPVPGDELGKLLHDCGVPVLVLNACQSAMHEATVQPVVTGTVHAVVRAIGSLAQAVIDQGIPAVLGMRYSIFVVTAAQYIGQLYASLAKGRGFGQAANEGRKHLYRNPDRWIGLQPRPLQDWFVPVVYEAMPVQFLGTQQRQSLAIGDAQRTLDPVQTNETLCRYVPDHGFVGRDETLLLLDRAFDEHAIVLLHAYAGQGKTTTTVEFARWYAQTGGLKAREWPQPEVLFTSFERHTDLTDVLNRIGQRFAPLLQANDIEWHAINDNAERRKLVIQLLRQIPILWIWDNVEPVSGFPAGTVSSWTNAEQAELADFLKQLKLHRETKVKVLLTSRRDERSWLGGIPYRVEMPRMSQADAAALALQLGRERDITQREIAQWQPLLDYCLGNPMTLGVLVSQAIKENRRTSEEIEQFVEGIRSGELEVQDENEGRDKSLGASLSYGFQNTFNEDELPVIALLHLFQGIVDVRALHIMGWLVSYVDEESVRIVNPPSLQDKTEEELSDLLQRASSSSRRIV